MLRAALLALLLVLVHTPLMAGAGVYHLPSYAPVCDDNETGAAS